MSKAISLDLRVRVLKAVADGMSCRQPAERFGISAARSAIRWRSLERSFGNARPKALGGDRRSARIEARATLILALLDETPDMTLQELKAALMDQGIAAGYGALWRFFERRGISRKKRPHTRARSARWFEGQLDLDRERLIFIDETWIATNMAGRYGRAPKGKRLRVGIPHGRWLLDRWMNTLPLFLVVFARHCGWAQERRPPSLENAR